VGTASVTVLLADDEVF